MTDISPAPPFAVPATIGAFWFLPTHGDGRYLGSPVGGRGVDMPYLTQVATAADALGFEGMLLPTGRSCEDSWVVASALVPMTQRLKFLVAVRPGLQSPTFAARMTATLDRLSGGRLLINVVTGGDPAENRGDGIHYDHDERYAVTDEFLEIYTALLRNETVDFKGKYFDIAGGRLSFPAVQTPYPPLFFGGSSLAANRLAARTVDKYLTWGEPPAAVAEKLEGVRALAAAAGRTLTFGIRLHVIVRETAEEAWQAADRLIEKLDDATIAAAQSVMARMDSVGQARMARLHGGKRDRLEVSPNLWAGVGLVRGGAGTALVGDPEPVAERIDEYRRLGIDTFILSGYPHLEEAYRVAELLLPRLPLHRPLDRDGAGVNMGPFGDTLARPQAVAARLSQS